MIEVAGITKAFGSRSVLQGVELTAPAGAVTLLVGSNGAGKSTLLRIVSGLLLPDAGTIKLNGHDLRAAREAALSQLSFLPQSPRFHPRLTTWQVARFYGRLRARSVGETEAELRRWALDDHLQTPTAHLSGGLRQRLGLAIFSLARAPLLLLDEPGLSLDPHWREELQRFLIEQTERGAAVLAATHLLGEWEGRAHRCDLLEEGRIRAELPPSALRQSFAALPAAIAP